MTERLLTPSKVTAWLDCAHFLTLRHLVLLDSRARDVDDMRLISALCAFTEYATDDSPA